MVCLGSKPGLQETIDGMRMSMMNILSTICVLWTAQHDDPCCCYRHGLRSPLHRRHHRHDDGRRTGSSGKFLRFEKIEACTGCFLFSTCVLSKNNCTIQPIHWQIMNQSNCTDRCWNKRRMIGWFAQLGLAPSSTE